MSDLPSPSAAMTGRLVRGKYRLEERLGESAFDIVYRAILVGPGESYAIRFLKTTGSLTPAALERFKRGAIALGRLRHPSILAVTDAGFDESRVPYLVTELFKGVTLADLCRFQNLRSLSQALPILRQVAAALDAAHDVGILHLDLRPDNVLVELKGQAAPIVKVLDIGRAELFAGSETSGAEPGKGLPPGTGSPLYVAPERLRYGKGNHSSDIYSFGVLTYEILGGKPPFWGPLENVLACHLEAAPPPLPLPAGVWQALSETLQKDPALRPRTAGEAVQRFQDAENEQVQQNQQVQPKPLTQVTPRAPIKLLPPTPQTGHATTRAISEFVLDNGYLIGLILAFLVVVGGVLLRSSLRAPYKPENVVGRTETVDQPDILAEARLREQKQKEMETKSRSSESESESDGIPSSPGVTLGFNDIDQACGDLSMLPNYLCLLNRGSEPAAGGARLVVDDSLATFRSHTIYHNGISINVEGKERYSLYFGPPKEKALLPGLYTEAMRWPFNEGPYPGIDVSVGSRGCNKEDGQFDIREIEVSGEKVVRFVADFETSCNSAVGRIAIGNKTNDWQGNVPDILRQREPR